jgi:hypothetical protein
MLNGQIKLKCPIYTLHNLVFKTVSVPMILPIFFAFFFVGLNKIRTFAKGNDDYGNKEYYLRDEVLR